VLNQDLFQLFICHLFGKLNFIPKKKQNKRQSRENQNLDQKGMEAGKF
jgi:hypothetical protein